MDSNDVTILVFLTGLFAFAAFLVGVGFLMVLFVAQLRDFRARDRGVSYWREQRGPVGPLGQGRRR